MGGQGRGGGSGGVKGPEIDVVLRGPCPREACVLWFVIVVCACVVLCTAILTRSRMHGRRGLPFFLLGLGTPSTCCLLVCAWSAPTTPGSTVSRIPDIDDAR